MVEIPQAPGKLGSQPCPPETRRRTGAQPASVPDLSAIGGDAWGALVPFLLAYLLIMATPGPNLLAVGCVAATRGRRGAVPMVLGIALGVGTLALVLLLMIGDPEHLANFAQAGG